MAGRKRPDDEKEEIVQEVPAGEQQGPSPAAGPPPSDYCILVNRWNHPLSCPLRTGRNVQLAAKTPGMNIHRSEPILKKDRTDILFTWQRLGKLGFDPVTGGESA